MDIYPSRKQRLGPEPTQRRIRHIQCILARNLTFTQNANQRTLSSLFAQQSSSQYVSGANAGSSCFLGSHYPGQNHLHHHHTRSLTPSMDLTSGASSPSRSNSYFRSPWKSYNQGIPKVKGPGSETGSTTASIISESGGRGSGTASSVIKEPIARLSAGIKASVFSSSNLSGGGFVRSMESSGYMSESGSGSGSGEGVGGLSLMPSTSKTKRSPFRISRDLSIKGNTASTSTNAVTKDPLKPQSSTDDYLSPAFGRHPTGVVSAPTTPPPSGRNQRGSLELPRPEQLLPQDTSGTTQDEKLPLFIRNLKDNASPILLDTYYTLHDASNDSVIYTSETVMSSNNPKYNSMEEHMFSSPVQRRANGVIVRIWAEYQGSEACLLIEWKIELCCLQFVGKDLRDLPTGFPNNTILFGFENGFYTAPDEDFSWDHPHTGLSTTSLPTPTSYSFSEETLRQIPGSLNFGLKQSYTYESVMRLNNLHECIVDTKSSRDEIKYNIELALKKDNAPIITQKLRGERTERLWHLQRQVGHELNVLEQAQERAESLRQEHAERRKALGESRERGQTQEMYLEENIINLANNKQSLYNVLKEYSTKRTELIATLFTIFPITESESDSNLLTICGAPLPNSVFTGLDEEMVSVSLGLTCHLVTLLAHYLSVPLRYPLIPMGSRAFVKDPVSMLVGPKEFPLFSKGQDRYRFEYGVFLLNKDIEQLLNSQGLQFMDLRETLPNLRYLMETILTTSPRSKFLSRKKQGRQDQEQLNNLFVTTLDLNEFDQILGSDSSHSSSSRIGDITMDNKDRDTPKQNVEGGTEEEEEEEEEEEGMFRIQSQSLSSSSPAPPLQHDEGATVSTDSMSSRRSPSPISHSHSPGSRREIKNHRSGPPNDTARRNYDPIEGEYTLVLDGNTMNRLRGPGDQEFCSFGAQPIY